MKALVLSGGGSHGAYQVGILKHLLGELRTRYDIFCGVSVGALNASFLSMFKEGEEELSSEQLLSLWNGLDTGKIYKNWFPFGPLELFWKPSVYDSSPLQKIVRTQLDVSKVRSSGKQLRVGAVGLNSATYRVFDQNYSDVQGAVLASSAFPAMLTPVFLEGQLWTDGGVQNITPLASAIDLGAEDIDIIQCSPIVDPSQTAGRVIDIAQRAIDLMCDKIQDDDLKLCRAYNQLVETGAATNKKGVKFRLFKPDPGLSPNSLDFSQASIQQMVAQGYADAKKIINQ